METALFCLVAYLIGSIPSGLLIARWVRGLDIREHGSRNTGATNVFRVVGKSWGLFVLFLDALKGAFAVKCSVWVFGMDAGIGVQLIYGASAILGHTFSIWLRFRGGKGVATSLGVFLAIVPIQAGLAFGIWILVFIVSHIVSLSSLAAALAFPLVLILTFREQEGFGAMLVISAILGGFIFYTHRQNVGRLLRREEKRLF